jgi:hypothetical protein
MITLERQGDVFVLQLGDGDTRFNGDTVPVFYAAAIAALDPRSST